ncbi:MAG: tRNA threonylcarbamoyladenosine dehydratase [Bacteroidetes bacterium]|nr:MAG: tRNA threonylcarbamoyladenosine dehydratase [Bacteroidota bacterium]
MENWKDRTELLLNKEGIDKLKNAKVLVVGLGGVGSYSAEMLCRAGVGSLHIIDADTIHPSNRNRQLLALISTNGQSKAMLMKERLLDINPELNIKAEEIFLRDELTELLLDQGFDFIIDAIDSLTPKILLIAAALKREIPIISSMGSGGKTNPAKIRIADFSETYNDKLARMLRKKMHKMGIYSGFKVVFSSEKTNPDAIKFVDDELNKKTTVGTISYMPPLFGSFMAAEVIRIISGVKEFENHRVI